MGCLEHSHVQTHTSTRGYLTNVQKNIRKATLWFRAHNEHQRTENGFWAFPGQSLINKCSQSTEQRASPDWIFRRGLTQTYTITWNGCSIVSESQKAGRDPPTDCATLKYEFRPDRPKSLQRETHKCHWCKSTNSRRFCTVYATNRLWLVGVTCESISGKIMNLRSIINCGYDERDTVVKGIVCSAFSSDTS